MAVYRAYYGDALYGQDTFGLSGSITDASAAVSCGATVTAIGALVYDFASSTSSSSSATASGQFVIDAASAITSSASVTAAADILKDAASAVSGAATVSASGEVLKDASVAASLQNVVVSVAETYAETDGYRDGYGLRTYGTFVYGENYSIEDASASIALTSSVAISYERVRKQEASITGSSSTTSNAVIDIVGAATITPTSTVSISYNRVISFEAEDDVTLTRDVSARYKWLPATDPTTTWSEADYLERAA